MKTRMIELNEEINEAIYRHTKLQKMIEEHSLDYCAYGIIVSASNANTIEAFIKNEGLYEQTLTLYQLENPEHKLTFSDFGFLSNANKSYLYEELVIPFTTSGDNDKEIERALEQMDEHLVAIENSTGKTSYFVERYHQELIEGIAKAYRIHVQFDI